MLSMSLIFAAAEKGLLIHASICPKCPNTFSMSPKWLYIRREIAQAMGFCTWLMY